MQTIIFRVDIQQGPSVQHRKLYSTSYVIMGTKIFKEFMYVCNSTALLYSRDWHNTVNQLYFNIKQLN